MFNLLVDLGARIKPIEAKAMGTEFNAAYQTALKKAEGPSRGPEDTPHWHAKF